MRRTSVERCLLWTGMWVLVGLRVVWWRGTGGIIAPSINLGLYSIGTNLLRGAGACRLSLVLFAVF